MMNHVTQDFGRRILKKDPSAITKRSIVPYRIPKYIRRRSAKTGYAAAHTRNIILNGIGGNCNF